MTGLSPSGDRREVAHEVLHAGVELREQAVLGLELVGVGVEAAEHDAVGLCGHARLDELGDDVELIADVSGRVRADRYSEASVK